jgi:hypothetical protein
MTNLMNENLRPLSEAVQWVPRGEGQRAHVSTMHRWASKGCRGVVLETLQVGGGRYTSREALGRFFERLSDAPPAHDAGNGKPAVIDHRRLEQVERALLREGL